MSKKIPDIDSVTVLLDEVARELILPRFRNLRVEDVRRKCTLDDPNDIVTVVDRQVEETLKKALMSWAPSIMVVGEESVHDEPGLLQLLDSDDPVWVLDPIDGTRNFADGNDDFGIMLALVVGGSAKAAWIHLPAHRHTFVAEAGSGAFWNGARIAVPRRVQEISLRGALHGRYMPDDIVEGASEEVNRRASVLPSTGSAAVEYTATLRGQRDFAIYYRLLPWDHAPGALILTEGGGCVEHLDDSSYSVRSPHQVTVAARSRLVSNEVRAWFKQSGSADLS